MARASGPMSITIPKGMPLPHATDRPDQRLENRVN